MFLVNIEEAVILVVSRQFSYWSGYAELLLLSDSITLCPVAVQLDISEAERDDRLYAATGPSLLLFLDHRRCQCKRVYYQWFWHLL